MSEGVHPRAGRPAERGDLVNVARLVAAYYTGRPDPAVPAQRVAFGTSGHRGSSLRESFQDAHIAAVSQAICELRAAQGTTGPLFLGMDTHALSEPALATALEVLVANDVEVRLDAAGGYTPTPVISHAIVGHNRGRSRGVADGIVVTPSHNPPEDGGFKYNPPHGGPAESSVTGWIEQRANAILAEGGVGVKRVPLGRARRSACVRPHDYVTAYVDDLGAVLDLEAVRAAGLRLGADPMGGAGVAYWGRIAERWGLDLEVVSDVLDPTFSFMSLDWDGRIRMDCSSSFAMARLIGLRERFDVAFGADTDHDRHGVVTRGAGLLPANAYLAVALAYLLEERPGWPATAAVGKTVVTSALLDRIAGRAARRVVEMPVGFKWFAEGLHDGSLGFAGEESAGASLLRRDGTAWVTDKDGIVLGLLAAELTARRGRDPAEQYAALSETFGAPAFARVDEPATAPEKALLAKLTPAAVTTAELAGEKITAVSSTAPGNGAAIGGLKVASEGGWFAVRPSGTEDVYKIYAESFRGAAHLRRLQDEARALVAHALAAG